VSQKRGFRVPAASAFHRSAASEFHRSAAPGFHRSAAPECHRSAAPEFHRSAAPEFSRAAWVEDGRAAKLFFHVKFWLISSAPGDPQLAEEAGVVLTGEALEETTAKAKFCEDAQYSRVSDNNAK
jgi:hypothetical protein